jgi:hypothetical protein
MNQKLLWSGVNLGLILFIVAGTVSSWGKTADIALVCLILAIKTFFWIRQEWRRMAASRSGPRLNVWHPR